MLLLTMTMSYGQPTKSVLIDREDAAYHLKRSDSLTGYKQLVREKQRDIDTLQARIAVLQSVILTLNQKDSATVKLYQEQLAVMKDQKALYADQLNGYEKLLRKEKRKRRFWQVLTGVVAGGAGYLILTK